jgi:hypothetical protein
MRLQVRRLKADNRPAGFFSGHNSGSMLMDAISAVAVEMSQASTANSVQLAVLKLAMNLEAESAAQLVAAIQALPTNNPPHLGNGVDTFA